MTDQLTQGQQAPAFTLPDANGNPVSLADYAGSKVVVYFYPAAGTPGCTKQACDFTENLGVLNDSGYAVLGISPDKQAKLAKFIEDEQLKFPLLSDPDKTVMTEWGAFGEKKNYGKVVQGVIRSTFVVDESGRIERALYNVRASGHVGRLLKELAPAASGPAGSTS